MTQADPVSSPIRDAASVILLRETNHGLSILMGQRGNRAAFMPNKFVFPGGAVDPQDAHKGRQSALHPTCMARLGQEVSSNNLESLVEAACRELREETGLDLKDRTAMRFVFRAITPPGLPRRFDARFFLCSAQAIEGNLDDFSAAEDELSHLQWIPLTDARAFDLPFITRVILAELAAMKDPFAVPECVPFYDHRDVRGEIRMLD